MVAAFHPELTDDLRLHEMFLESFDRREVTQA
jgi:glutamine amidotransferase PdxT